MMIHSLRAENHSFAAEEVTMRVALAAAFLLAFATLAPAQTFRGGIQGTVTDQTAPPCPGQP